MTRRSALAKKISERDGMGGVRCLDDGYGDCLTCGSQIHREGISTGACPELWEQPSGSSDAD